MRKIVSVFLLMLILVNCRKPIDPSSSNFLLENNNGQFQFDDYTPLSDKPVSIHYYIPDFIDRSNAPILFVFPGMNRNANTYRDTWISLADEKGIMIFSFEFSTTYFPNSISYQQGFVIDENGTLIDESLWSFSVVEPVFDFIKESLSYNLNYYDVFGHSGGAQFVHRFILFKPFSRVRKAIAANSGWYTVPDTTINYPYGLNGVNYSNINLIHSFGKNLEIHLGLLDNNPNDPSLRKTPEANAQGLHRLDRGRYFMIKSDSIAQYHNSSFNWVKKEVPNVAHDHAGMSVYAANELY